MDDSAVWKAFEDFNDTIDAFPSALGLTHSGTRLAERIGLSVAPSFDIVRITGNDVFDAEAIRNFFVSYLASFPEGADLSFMQQQWATKRDRAEAVDTLFGGFQNVFLHNPHLFRVSAHPAKVYLLEKKVDSQQSEDELLAVATSVTTQLFSNSPDPESPEISRMRSFGMAALLKKTSGEEDLDEKGMCLREVVAKLKAAPDQAMKKDDLGSDFVKNSRKMYDQICDTWGSLQDMLRAYPDLFVLTGDVPGKEIVKLRPQDEETKVMEEKRTILETVKDVLKQHYSIMHPDDLRNELHRSKPIIMGRIMTVFGGFNQMLEACNDVFEVVSDPKTIPPPFVRLRWPAFCGLCGCWPETPEAWQGHVFSEKHKDMRRSVIRLKDGRDPDRWPVLRMIEERIRRAGGKMKLGNIPNFGKNRPLFATYVRKLYGGFKQLVESNPRFKVLVEEGSADPTVSLVDDWRQDRLEGVVIRVKQKDTLIWIRPDSNPNIEFFLHRDRSLGGREIANSPAFVVPRVGDRMSFLPSDVPADPNPFAEGAIVLETVPDFRLRFAGTIVHRERDRYLLRAEFQTAAGVQEAGDLFEVIWRDETAKMAVDSGHTRVNFVRSCRPSKTYPCADDVTVDAPMMPSPHRVQPAVPASFAFTSDATYRGRPVASMNTFDIGGGRGVSAAGPAPGAAETDMRGQRTSGRFQTWPVVYFDQNAAAAAAAAATGSASSNSSGGSSPRSGEKTPTERGPGDAGGGGGGEGKRTPLKLNPSKPITEFSFRPTSSSASPSAVAPVANSGSQGVLAASAPSISTAAVASPPVLYAQPPVVPADAITPFKVTIDTRNDEADLLPLLSPAVLEFVKEKAPDFVNTLVSVAMDVGALAVLSFADGTTLRGEQLVTQEEVKGVINGVGDLGAEGSSVFRHSLHLVSTITHPISQELMGYTVKVGRAIIGLADVLAEFLPRHMSVLILGEFCTGKTVLLRDIARRFSKDPSGRLVAVVDSAGELGGAADGKSHAGLGASRCVRCVRKGQLPDAVDQTVVRHSISCVVVDGVCNVEGVNAVLRAHRRGVSTVVSIGATSLAAAACDEVFRPLLSRLPGGRKGLNIKPPFDIAIELTSIGSWIIHHNINASIDALFAKQPLAVPVTRVKLNPDGSGTYEKGLYPSQADIGSTEW